MGTVVGVGGDMTQIKELPEPELPTWWFAYDGTDCDYTDFVELEGMAFVVRGREPTGRQKTRMDLRWHYQGNYVEGHILDGCWMHYFPFKRYGWAVGASPDGVHIVPELDGRWLVAGEARSLKAAVKAFRKAVTTLHEQIENAKGE